MRMSKKAKEFIERAKLTEEYWLEKAKMDFSIELSKQASSLNIKSKDLAQKLGTSAPYISKVFTGNANLTIESMVKLARAANARLEIKVVPTANQSAKTTNSWDNIVHIPTVYLGRVLQPRNPSNTEVKVNYFDNSKINQTEKTSNLMAA